ncbi:ABA4-like family protein [Micromonospora sp. NPDC050187]|uniref:ABA4-like family protein n=1 Tax=Micromonospora sp. NPDC050187 TaxID=3364277 RepID=UPI0037A919FB
MTGLIFDLTFPLVVPFWALMILLPGWSWTRRIVGSPLVVVPPLVGYLVLAVAEFDRLWPVVSRPSLAGLTEFLGTPAGAATLWAHVIAFDLFVGRWIYLDGRERGVHPLVTGPILALTILLSPVGLLVHLAVREVAGRPPVGATPTGGAVGQSGTRR